MTDKPLISIVIVTHGRPDHVIKCLESCYDQDYPNREIVVVINPVDPDTENRIRQDFPDTRIVRSHRNLGAFPAKNIGIANTDGEFIMLLDDDAYFQSDEDLSKLYHAIESEPELGAVTCNIDGPFEEPPLDEDRYVWYFKDGFTLFHKKVYTEWVGYYPDLFFRAGGEPWIAMTLWDQKRPIKQISNVSIFHALTKKGRNPWHFQFYSVRHHILIALAKEPLSILPLSLASKFVNGFRHYVIKGKSPKAWFVGWLSIPFFLPWILENRNPISKQTWQLLQKMKKQKGLKKLPF